MTAQVEMWDRPIVSRAAARKAAMQAARDRAERGMDRAARRAEALHADWCLKALDAVRAFARGQAGAFTVEQMRAVLEPQLPPVDELRVWGKVVVDARKAGFIEPVPRVFMAAASSNGCLKPAWRRGPQA